jgi:hypothetical protein
MNANLVTHVTFSGKIQKQIGIFTIENLGNSHCELNNRGSIFSRGRHFSLFHYSQTDIRAHPASYKKGTVDPFVGT